MEDAWADAIAQATKPMSTAGARERRRHALAFADWCSGQGIDPLCARREDVARHVASAANGDRRQASKIRCSLRAVGASIDADHSARTFGLSQRHATLDGLSESVARLIEATALQQPARRAVRLSAIRRLMCWAKEVDAPPESLSVVDLAQYRSWLREVGVPTGEALVVARDFVELRWSVFGRALLGERSGSPTLICLEPPLRPRFG
jgi:hypothetical protein